MLPCSTCLDHSRGLRSKATRRAEGTRRGSCRQRKWRSACLRARPRLMKVIGRPGEVRHKVESPPTRHCQHSGAIPPTSAGLRMFRAAVTVHRSWSATRSIWQQRSIRKSNFEYLPMRKTRANFAGTSKFMAEAFRRPARFIARGRMRMERLQATASFCLRSALTRERSSRPLLDLDGKQVWQRDVGAFSSKFGYAPSPVLYQSFVIIAADNWGGGYLAAIDSKTGEIAWRVARGETSTYSSPLVANIGGRDQLVISGCGVVASYDPATGDQLWKTSCISEATCGTAVTDGTYIFRQRWLSRKRNRLSFGRRSEALVEQHGYL